MPNPVKKFITLNHHCGYQHFDAHWVRRIIFAFCMFMFFIVYPTIATPTWHIEVIDTGGNVGDECSLALDSLNRPHISYHYEADSFPWNPKLKYAFWDGNNWQIQIIDDVGEATSIAIDSSDYPHISYYGLTGTTSYGLKYAYYNGSNWIISVVETGIATGDTSIYLDSLEDPKIAYNDSNVPQKVKFASFDGSNWAISIVDSLNGPQNARLCLDSSNLPHISYIADLVADLRYGYFDGTNWQLQTVDNANLANFNSLALDTSGNPHIAYERGSNGLRYAYNLGSDWQFIDLDVGLVIQEPSINIDSLNHEHIAYCKSSMDILRYAYFNGLNWSFEDIEPLNYGTGISIKTNSDNFPHIAYQQTFGFNLNYAWFGEGSLGVSLNYLSASPRNESIEIKWDLQNTDEINVIGLNLYRVKSLKKGKMIRLNSQLINVLVNGIYIDSEIENENEYIYKLTAILNSGKEIDLGNTSCVNGNLFKAFCISNIYPQPAKNYVNCTLQSDFTGMLTYKLFDISGKLVKTNQLQMQLVDFSFNIPTDSLSNGIYVLLVSSQGVHDQTRIVVTR